MLLQLHSKSLKPLINKVLLFFYRLKTDFRSSCEVIDVQIRCDDSFGQL